MTGSALDLGWVKKRLETEWRYPLPLETCWRLVDEIERLRSELADLHDRFDHQAKDADKWHILSALFDSETECVEADPDVRGGKPCLPGTRMTIAQVLAQIAEGDSVDELVSGMELSREPIVAALQALAKALDQQACFDQTDDGELVPAEDDR